MKRSLLLVSIALVFLLVFSCMTNSPQNTKVGLRPFEPGYNPEKVEIAKPDGFKVLFGELKDGEYTEGKVLVGYEAGSRSEVDKIVKALKGKVVLEIPEINVVSISFNGTVSKAYEIIKKLDVKGIKYVEPSYKRELIEPTRVERNPEIFSKKGNVLLQSRDYGEELSNELWGLEAMGVSESLWNEASGTGIIVAVVDTGVDGTHPDLEGQVIEGYRPFLDKELPAGTDSSFGGSHGTHVAGTIAARKDGKGIVGVAPNAKIMPIVIFDDPAIVGGNGYVGDDYVAAGIIWAVNHGAKVMNNSWGGWGYSYTMKAAFDYALKNNVIMVVSAGNAHSDSHHQYPAGYPGVIQVAAAEYNGGNYKTVWFSSRSDGVIVAAPGVAILSTVPGENSIGYEGHNPNVPATNGGTYDYYQGTSMAAPHVTGTVAVLLQKFPGAKAWQIRKLLEQTAMDIDDTGWDHHSGYGLVQLNHALAGTIPTTGGIEELRILVKDALDSFGVPTVWAQLLRDNGACYYAKTDANGHASFYQIDDMNISEDSTNVVIAGPDHMDRALAPTKDGSVPGGWAIALRMAEERKPQILNVTSDGTVVAVLSSEFKVEFNNDLGRNALLIVSDPMLNETYGYYTYQKDMQYDLSSYSGQITLGIVKVVPATTDITITGTATLNGVKIPISGVLKAGKTFAVVDDYQGMNFGTDNEPLYAWWTVFGKIQ
jgi:subtilisin family serine protease